MTQTPHQDHQDLIRVMFAESLVREIQDAHAKLMAPTPATAQTPAKQLRRSQQHSPRSPSGSHMKSKRARTATETSRTKSKPDNPVRPNFSQPDRDIFEFRGSSDGEVELVSHGHTIQKFSQGKAEGRKSRKKDIKERKHVSAVGSATSGTDMNEDMTQSMSKEILSDSSMPPPTAKVVSEAQTQRSEISTIPTIANSTPAKPNSQDDARTELNSIGGLASVPMTSSDDRMPTPTISSHSKTKGSKASNNELSAISSNEQVPPVNVTFTSDLDRSQEPSSSASIISPSRVITVHKTADIPASTEDLHVTCNDEDSKPQPGFHTSGTAMPIVFLPEPSHRTDDHDELSISLQPTESSQPVQIAKVRKRKTTDEELDAGPGSDYVTIGLPKENYQPRPSRSRSGNTGEELIVPADYSKRPEAVAKSERKRDKRRKTTAFQELVLKEDMDEDDDPEVLKVKISGLQELKPFKGSDVGEAKKEEAVEDLQDHTQIEDSATKKPAQAKKQRGRPKKATQESGDREIALGDLEAEHDEVQAEQPLASSTAKATSKRGRKSKVSLAIVDEESEDDQAGPKIGESAQMPESECRVLEETTGNCMANQAGKQGVVRSSPKERASCLPPETPHKSSAQSAKGPDKHSPISSGKVGYRVGLSKRARIAPLLRIVRK